jgi:CheY-like chemotaxis protein
LAGENILIVEDNPLNLELITDILEANGYVVTSAITGADALKLVETETPDLILMDIQLPGLDGLTVTGMIKKRPGFENVPIIALTAHAMRGDEEKAREAGCDGYISKPIDTRTITKTIMSYLEGTTGNE